MTGYNGIINVTNSNNKVFYAKSITDEDGFIQVTIEQSADKTERLKIESKRTIIEESHFTEADYPLTIEPNFSTLGSSIEISRQEPSVSFLPDDSIRDILGINASPINEK